MKGWQIFAHSVRLVFNNLDAALKLSLLPYALSAIAYVYFGIPAIGVLEVGDPAAILAQNSTIWTGFGLYLIIATIVALWIAVSWHRYVLLEEYPSGWFPTFHGGQIGAYFIKGILIFLLVFGVVLGVSLVVGLLIGWMGPVGAAVTSLTAMAAATYFFYRLCPLLPSAAVGKPMRFNEAWESTAESGGTIATLVVLVVLASLVMQLPQGLGTAGGLFEVAYTLVVNWLSMLVGASVLTTFYGHFIEGRHID